jgi:glutathionyl-hydroquinone reductase
MTITEAKKNVFLYNERGICDVYSKYQFARKGRIASPRVWDKHFKRLNHLDSVSIVSRMTRMFPARNPIFMMSKFSQEFKKFSRKRGRITFHSCVLRGGK